MTAIATRTLGQFISYGNGGIAPGWAQVTAVTECAWISGTDRATLILAEDDDAAFGLTVWVIKMVSGSYPEVIYKGGSRSDAEEQLEAANAAHSRSIRHHN